MKIDALQPRPGAPIPFEYRSIQILGAEPGCYVLTNAGGDILYIGQAVSLRDRLRQHLDSGRHRESTPIGKASVVRVLSLPAVQLNAYERGWISQCELSDGYLPPLNKVAGHL